MESLFLQLAQPGPHQDRLIASGVLLLAAALAPCLAWRLARQRADIRALSSSFREGTKSGGALPHLPKARTAPVRRLAGELADWTRRHSHQIQWMKSWTQKRGAEWRSLRGQLTPLLAPAREQKRGLSSPGAGGPAGDAAETLDRAARQMDETLQGVHALARRVREMEGSGNRPETAALRPVLEGVSRSLSEAAQLLEEAQRHLEPAAGGSAPMDGAEALRRMMALAEGVAEEHRKMEGDLAKLLESFLPEEALPREERASAALDPAASP
ncbi:MAG: hypothetical protein A3J27_07305 [Candidatus Tectomicrobia bacterium RIFCSPLOWO2_12_FULL_69_37]|nr:MAG: hypothetical protein A3J27_07305 [Candidatus Tectomicrobia bacterium RIFCSPLOWO2_12_FULL_69_37]